MADPAYKNNSIELKQRNKYINTIYQEQEMLKID
jgi:hypothetical protein